MIMVYNIICYGVTQLPLSGKMSQRGCFCKQYTFFMNSACWIYKDSTNGIIDYLRNMFIIYYTIVNTYSMCILYNN